MEPSEKPAGAENAETRQCRKCQGVFPYTIEFYPTLRGEPHGVWCRACVKKRRKAYESVYKQERIAERNKRLAEKAAAAPTPASEGVVAQTDAAKPLVLPSAEAQLAATMRADVKGLAEAAPKIVATILSHASNSKHPLHEWALKFIADRVMPKKLYEDLGAQAAGSKAGRGTVRPAVTVIIQQTGPAPSDPLRGRVITMPPETILEQNVTTKEQSE